MEGAHDKRRSPAANYEYKVEQRAVKHREISHRNNMTSCRSPTRDLDTRWIKTEMHRKRQFEFFKRRPVDHGTYTLLSAVPRHRYSRETLDAPEHMTQTLTSIRQPLITSRNVKLQRDAINFTKQTVSTVPMNDEHDLKSDEWNVPVLNSVRLHGKIKKERVLLKEITQLSNTQKTLQTASIQTESGFVTVKEADVHQLADYLEEALQREEALKKKLSNLQKSAATLLHSTELLWKTRCDEDLLKSKIKALEAQLQACIKKVPQDGVKKVMLKMEKQREEYEQKAVKAIQRAENEKAEAQSKMEYLQGALETAQAESEWWQRLCEELKVGSSQLKKRQDECTDQMLQLQGHLERSVEQEEMLRKQSESLQQERAELHSCISELEEENLNLKEHLQELTGHNHDRWNSNAEVYEDASVDQLLMTDNSIARQLSETEHRLRMKEKKCMELQADLEALEQECYSYQSRMTQCREELNILKARKNNSRSRGCGSWLCIFLFLLLLMVVLVAALWFYHPPAREQLRQFYSVLEQRMGDYLIQKASAQHGACFRPV
ncbi:TRAF3-interacting JNK-activating modulator-like isoform X1 [Cyprinus carpio]|uniref:TRAF3-interacting JNK-activating modulator-like isoform X1 n=2 Tax=Cyprinus carpio TaxID=7962 RepID=A0A9Q9YDH4_CYPCA|nr:TRAF3-interacting JNK-activating modulator-like isoform X1 [Cyprinus carpio]XP_042618212.1 TRAF3-interacting JNK-activating modulator-like isoform X1 [Cyprinus carpio]